MLKKAENLCETRTVWVVHRLTSLVDGVFYYEDDAKEWCQYNGLPYYQIQETTLYQTRSKEE